jgi:NAD(P)-dependent dehydrogenase (short-subunit alcohol dehydrogenase family)
MSLKDRVYGITGGASGIGLATAQLVSERGGTVCIGDIDPVTLKEAEVFFTTMAVPFMVSQLDVSDKSQVETWVAGIVEKFGRLDGAVNAAGIFGKACAVSELEDEAWHRIIAVNLTGCMYCMRAELNHISPGGSIVNLTSIHGTKGQSRAIPICIPANRNIGMARHGAYGASKHGIIALTEAAAKENGDREIRINAIAPGAIYTPMMQRIWDESKRPADAPFDNPTAFQRQGKAQEVANVIAFLLGPESTFVSGSVYAVDGAWL